MNAQPQISLIAAIAKDTRIIGNEAKIPWHIPEDFKYFKETTMGHPMIMGRKTFETFPKLLPGRTHIVLTRNEDYEVPEGVIIANSIEKAIGEAKKVSSENKGTREIFIIGGGQVYELGMKYADKLYITIVDTEVEGNIFFPEYESVFTKTVSEKTSSDKNFSYTFKILEKE
jgi:dihydrofolate reductase